MDRLVAILLAVLAVFTAQVDGAIAGDANYADPSYGAGYLAMRLPRGTQVQVCGAGGCRAMTVNDYGPVRATGDIADIGLRSFMAVCGYTEAEARLHGECHIRVRPLGAIALPPTDTL